MHLNSGLYNSRDGRILDISIARSDIERIEKKHGDKRTLIVGDMNIGLVNAANDYEIACRIRKYIEHVSELLDSSDPKKQEWLAWAEEKADWFDPAIASEDPIFGVRKHEESNDQKELKTLYSAWQLGYKHI